MAQIENYKFQNPEKSNSILTKEELTYYQNLRNIWLELNYLLRNPPENLNYKDLDSATKLFTAMTEAKQIMDELEKYVNNSNNGVLTSIQKYFRSKISFRLWSYLPAIIYGDITPFAKLLNKMAIKLNEIKLHFCTAYGLENILYNYNKNSCINSNESDLITTNTESERNTNNELNNSFNDNRNNNNISVNELSDDLETSVSSTDNDLNSSYISSFKEYVNLGLNKQSFDNYSDKQFIG